MNQNSTIKGDPHIFEQVTPAHWEPMLIRVRTNVGTWKVEVSDDPNPTLRTLKEVICRLYNIPVHRLKLAHNMPMSQPLGPDSSFLKELDIIHGTMLVLLGKLSFSMRIGHRTIITHSSIPR